MSCSCTGNTNTCNCNRCRGIRLNQFPETDTISSADQFVMADNELITYETLLNSILASVTPAVIVPNNREIDITGDYDLGVGIDYIICTGTGDVRMPPISTAYKPVTIIQASGTATIVPNGTDGTDQATVIPGNAFKAVPYQLGSNWVNG